MGTSLAICPSPSPLPGSHASLFGPWHAEWFADSAFDSRIRSNDVNRGEGVARVHLELIIICAATLRENFI